LFFESFAIEYETVKARFPKVLPFGSWLTPYETPGKVSCMYGSSQLPSKMIAAFCLPSASPHQPTPSCAGVWARPVLTKLT